MGSRNILGIFQKVFAGNAGAGERDEFGSNPDGDPADDFEQGWPEEYSSPSSGVQPRRTEYNDLFAKLTAVASDVNKYGILPWDTNLLYEKGAFVVGSDDALYKATVQNGAVDPVSDPQVSEWKKFVSGVATTYVLTPPAGGDLRQFDPNNTSLQEMADVLASLIKDLTD